MHLNTKKYIAIFAFVVITVPICEAHTDSASWETTQPMTIGTVQVKPGSYQLKAYEDEDQLQVIQDGKVITSTVCYWEALPSRAASTEIKVDSNRVIKVQFKGRSEAIIFFGQ